MISYKIQENFIQFADILCRVLSREEVSFMKLVWRYIFGLLILFGIVYQACDAYENSDGEHTLKYYRNQTIYRSIFAVLCGSIYYYIQDNDLLFCIFFISVFVSICYMMSAELGAINDVFDALTYLSIATAISNRGALFFIFTIQLLVCVFLFVHISSYDTEKVCNSCISTAFSLVNIVLSFVPLTIKDTVLILITQACILPLISGIMAKVWANQYHIA